MTRKYSSEYKNLQPYVVEDIRKVVGAVGGSATGGSGMQVHTLSGPYHSGELAQSQASWAATKVELSNHAALPDVHHAKLHAITDALLGAAAYPSTSVGGQTERCHVAAAGTQNLDCSDQGPIATPASTSMGWSFSSSSAASNQIICALKPAAAGGVSSPYYLSYYSRLVTGVID